MILHLQSLEENFNGTLFFILFTEDIFKARCSRNPKCSGDQDQPRSYTMHLDLPLLMYSLVLASYFYDC